MNTSEIEKVRLNPEQYQAVNTLEGPVLVIAGPGTGKTQVLSLRIANILQKTDALPGNILCLTFTESGVTAMRERLLRYIGTEAYYVKIHTFHSFCNEIILSNPNKFSFSRDLKQLDDLNKVKIMREVLDSLPQDTKHTLKPLHDPYFYQNQILNGIQTLKREGISPEELLNRTQEIIQELEANPDINSRTGKPKLDWQTNRQRQDKNLELYELYKKYQELIKEKGFYDYEDMILYVINKFEEDKDLLAENQEKYLYILVDEYQDTNGSQNQLLKLLGSFDKSPNIFAVGDDDQAIYRFQGANVENLLFFTKEFENVKTITLTKNYRSSQAILDLSKSLVEKNTMRLSNLIKDVNKDLKAESGITNQQAEVFEFKDGEYEVRFITEKIKELNDSGIAYSDIAIFYRNHSDAEDLINAMIKKGLPFKLAAGSNALDELIIQQFLNLLKTIMYTNEDREFTLFKILFYDFLGFKRLDTFKVTNQASFNKTSLFNIISTEEQLKAAGVSEPEKFITFAQKLADWRALSENTNLIDLTERIFQESGYLDFVFFKDKNIENINSVNSFYNYIKSIYTADKKINLNEFLNDLKLYEENRISIPENELDIERNGVNLMTAHKSKGLEFPYVFVMNLYDKNWEGKPERNFFKLPITKLDVKTGNEKEEDERRLLYVALTRAKQKLFLTYSNQYDSSTGKKEVSPSQFIYELDNKLIDKSDSSKYESEDIAYFKERLTSNHLIDHSEDEKKYLESLVKKFQLSATSFLTYIECPLKFKYEHLIKLPRPSNKTAILGSSIHFALEKLGRHLINHENYSIDDLLKYFESYLHKNLHSSDLYQQVLTEGKAILTDYIMHYKSEFEIPAEVEYTFHKSETIFEIPGQEPIVLKGKLDKIEWLNKEQNLVRVVDYKVKDPQSQNEIKGLTKKADPRMYYQLLFYYILADCDKYFKPKLGLDKYKVAEVQIDFLKPNKSGLYKKETFPVIQEDVQLVKEKIIDVVTRIRNLEFSGNEGGYPLCHECDYCKEAIQDL